MSKQRLKLYTVVSEDYENILVQTEYNNTTSSHYAIISLPWLLARWEGACHAVDLAHHGQPPYLNKGMLT